jgi:4-oxalocrotonate tautomerase
VPPAGPCTDAIDTAGPRHRVAILPRRSTMPVVTVQMFEGRTPEQKRELVAAITDAVVRITKTTPEATQVIINEVPRDHWAFAGKLASET